MQIESHKTRIGVLRDHVGGWRKSEGWSREAVALAIVEAHKASNGPTRTGIHFDSMNGDSFTTAKNNADRIFRWLDDETKDTNFMPANFEDSILFAMPDEIRLACINEILRPFGMRAQSFDTLEGIGLHLDDVCEMASSDAEALQAVAKAVSHPTAENVDRALRHTAHAAEKKARVVQILEGARKAMAIAKIATGSALGKFFHGPERRAAARKESV